MFNKLEEIKVAQFIILHCKYLSHLCLKIWVSLKLLDNLVTEKFISLVLPPFFGQNIFMAFSILLYSSMTS